MYSGIMYTYYFYVRSLLIIIEGWSEICNACLPCDDKYGVPYAPARIYSKFETLTKPIPAFPAPPPLIVTQSRLKSCQDWKITLKYEIIYGGYHSSPWYYLIEMFLSLPPYTC